MRLPIVLPLLVLLSLGACSKPADPAAKAAAALDEVRFKPGLYQTKVEIKQFDMPGMPPQVVAMMKSKMLAQPLTYCLTPQDAAKGAQGMKEQMGKGQCRFDKFNAAGGTMDSEMTCNSGGKGEMHMVAHGNYSDSGNVVTASVDVGTGATGKMHMEQVTTTTRIGDCTK